MHPFVVTMLALGCCGHAYGRTPHSLLWEENGDFNWSTIEPSRDLRWHECYTSFLCARMEVPLDWRNVSNELTVRLALTKAPATVPYDDPTFAGSILINPGGPAGSGVGEILTNGYEIRDSIVDTVEKHFEVVSWDPRGVQFTTPQVSCFGSDWERDIWQDRDWAYGQLDSSDTALNVKWAARTAFTQLCAESEVGKFEGGLNMRQFMSMALTAHDMIAILDAIEKERLLKLSSSAAGDKAQHPIMEKKKPALLNYWGFSYGTYLGNTFASLFPDRIGRMVLDGNVDPVDYTATGWLANLNDNNKNLHWFYHACFEAKNKCALFESGVKSPLDIEKKLIKLLRDLHDTPLPVVHEGGASVITYPDMTNLVHQSLYRPLEYWRGMAQVTHDLLNGNVTSMLRHLQHLDVTQQSTPDPKVLDTSLGVTKPDSQHENDMNLFPSGWFGNLDAEISILCGDGAPLSLSKDEWRDRIDILKNQSLIAGPFWASITFNCQHWPSSLRPAMHNRFTGPFSSKLADYDERSSPILFIGNAADPVTPLRNAVANSKCHGGSVVLIQNTPGHCAGPSNPNQCTYDVIRRFFSEGVLPEKGKVCQGDRSPWDKDPTKYKGRSMGWSSCQSQKGSQDGGLGCMLLDLPSQ